MKKIGQKLKKVAKMFGAKEKLLYICSTKQKNSHAKNPKLLGLPFESRIGG